jgi:Raf kinase inhibitor-like YbhB/YbcL family protein
VALKDDYKGA